MSVSTPIGDHRGSHYIGLDRVAVIVHLTCNLDVGTMGSTAGSALHARGPPSLLSYRGWRICTSFDWG